MALLLTILSVSGVIFFLACGWVLVERLARRSRTANPDSCDLPRHECGHCLRSEGCSMRPHDSDDAE